MAFFQRLAGALFLRAATFEEIEHDPTATTQAAFVVILASVAQALRWLPESGVHAVVIGTAWALMSWSVWAALLWVIGTHLMPESATEADVWQLLRTMGFAAAPGVLGVVTVFVPAAANTLTIVVGIWILFATVLAVRQALDYKSTLHAMVACLIALAIIIGLSIAAGYVLGHGVQPVS